VFNNLAGPFPSAHDHAQSLTGEIDPLTPNSPSERAPWSGYARVSTKGQLLDRQMHALTQAGCIRIFADKKSGKNAEREELANAMDYLRAGDTLAVPSLDRLCRSIEDLITIVAGLRRRGIGFTSLHEALDTTTPAAGELPCLRRPGRVHPRAHRRRNQRGPAARARGVRLGRPRDDTRADPPRP